MLVERHGLDALPETVVEVMPTPLSGIGDSYSVWQTPHGPPLHPNRSSSSAIDGTPGLGEFGECVHWCCGIACVGVHCVMTVAIVFPPNPCDCSFLDRGCADNTCSESYRIVCVCVCVCVPPPRSAVPPRPRAGSVIAPLTAGVDSPRDEGGVDLAASVLMSPDAAPSLTEFGRLRVAFVDDGPPNQRVGIRFLKAIGVPEANVKVMSDGACAPCGRVCMCLRAYVCGWYSCCV